MPEPKLQLHSNDLTASRTVRVGETQIEATLAGQMVRFWWGKGDPRKEERCADGQEQKELKTRYSRGCYRAVIPQYCLLLLELGFDCSVYVVCLQKHHWPCFKLTQTIERNMANAALVLFLFPYSAV